MTDTTHQAVEAAEREKFDQTWRETLSITIAPSAKSIALQGWLARAALTLPQEVAAEVGLKFGPDEDGIVWPEPAITTPSPNLAEYFSAPQVRAMIAAASRSPAPAGVAGGVDANWPVYRENGSLDWNKCPFPHNFGKPLGFALVTNADRHIPFMLDGGAHTFKSDADKVLAQPEYKDTHHIVELWPAATQAQPSPHPAVGGSGGATGARALELLRVLVGNLSDPNIGWRGIAQKSNNHFRCEFCGMEDLDCSKIAHTSSCAVPKILEILRADTPDPAPEQGRAVK
jgi:hypothetical protein